MTSGSPVTWVACRPSASGWTLALPWDAVASSRWTVVRFWSPDRRKTRRPLAAPSTSSGSDSSSGSAATGGPRPSCSSAGCARVPAGPSRSGWRHVPRRWRSARGPSPSVISRAAGPLRHRVGALSFNWRLILAPPAVLDAVVVHELAHLRIRGHSRSFWHLVEHHAPQTSDARRWLRAHAREVRAALE